MSKDGSLFFISADGTMWITTSDGTMQPCDSRRLKDGYRVLTDEDVRRFEKRRRLESQMARSVRSD